MSDSPQRSVLLSGLLHGGAILLILAATGVRPSRLPRIQDVLWIPLDLEPRQPAARSAGGGGGGAHADAPASLGNPPRFALRQFVAPRTDPQISTTILPMEPTLLGSPTLQAATLPLGPYGVPDGLPGRPSDGPGDGGGIGDGHGTGIGPGDGAGLGRGKDGGIGGGGDVVYEGPAGGGVTAPTLVAKIEPEYSEEARKARLQGAVMLRIEVNTRGQAQHITVRQSLGLGLDERAIEAVGKWRFNPGKVNGRPAVVVAYVEVNFRLL
jgi:TonB family protein